MAQETFLRAHREREALRDPAAAVAWLYSIATHVSLDRLRQRARRRSTEAHVDPADVSPSDAAPSAQLRVEQEEMSVCVQGYVADLSDSYWAVLLLHDAHGLTSPEIAELLGDSTGSVKIRLHRARKKLQDSLESGCSFSHDSEERSSPSQNARSRRSDFDGSSRPYPSPGPGRLVGERPKGPRPSHGRGPL